MRNDLSLNAAGPQEGFQGQLQELAALYQQVRHDFQTVVRDAQSALQERDRYIEHLVNQVHDLQERYRSAEPDDGLEEMTNAFTDGTDGTTGGLDEASSSDASDDDDEFVPPGSDDATGEVESESEETP